MSISEQIEDLRRIAKEWSLDTPINPVSVTLNQAADTIESLSAKLQSVNTERSVEDCGGWIDGNKVVEQIENEIDGVIVKDTYSKGKNAGLRKAKIFIEEQMNHEP